MTPSGFEVGVGQGRRLQFRAMLGLRTPFPARRFSNNYETS